MLDSLNKALDDWSKVVKSWFRIDYDAIDNSKSKDINDVILEEIKEPDTSVKVTEIKGVPTDSQINRMTKLQLEELGREFGIELDRRKKKATLVEEIKSVIYSK
jgi:hypothetical protein